MYKSCSRCGKIHDTKYKCKAGTQRTYQSTQERKLRSTYKWQQKSLQIRDRANWLCEVCRDNNVFTYENLEVHHIDKVSEHPEKLLEDDNLVCLCVMHHKMADAGQIDRNYLKSLAKSRDE